MVNRNGTSALAGIFLNLIALMLIAVAARAQGPQHPRDREITDADTRAWWHTTEDLSGDAMEGRDTGSAAYQRAADYVAGRFRAAGLQPAAAQGSYFQTVLMHEVSVIPQRTAFTVVRSDGSQTTLTFLQQITIFPTPGMPSQVEAALTFRGYCGKDAMGEIADRIVVCFGTQRAGLPSGSDRVANARAAHAAGLINVDDPYFTIEPPRWPFAYARTVTLRVGTPTEAPHTPALLNMRISAEAFASLIAGSGQDAAAILKAGGARQPLPNFEIPARLRLRVHVAERDISSPNVLGVLPGASQPLSSQYVVVSAHLDGYGYGTPVQGDNLYNGTLDDAAYVALLIQLAGDLRSKTLPAPGRSILFAAFTAEEKGLLGSRWFVSHPTIPLAQLAANVNLDQLRPLFPLKILTAEALSDTTVGETARRIGKDLHIQVRPDAEPERHLLYRADQYPFLMAHVPAISFVFGYDPGTESERRYREWYQVRYHRPQDDLTQPMDFEAAHKFNELFYRLVHAIATSPERPRILAASQFAPRE
ncbi:MAG TPA: M28 family peptidase [Steroidobacteraceae bacterium]|jgi:hypothetical protein